jgi:hypothetical protein
MQCNILMVMVTVIRVMMTLVGLTWSITEFQKAGVVLNVSERTFLTRQVQLYRQAKCAG